MSYFDTEFFVRKQPIGELRISARQNYGGSDRRYASMRMEDADGHVFVQEKGEVILRKTPKGARQLKVKFLELDRNPYQLVFQFFGSSGNPRAEGSFPLRADEIPTLLEFLGDIQRVHLPAGSVRVEPGALNHKKFTDAELIAAIRTKPDLAAEVVRSNATSADVKALGYRKKQLERFAALLTDPEFFDREREKTRAVSSEKVWQDFFENNPWIFGYGLSYIFMSSIDPTRLRNAVAGFSVAWKGKEPDAVLKTHGAINSLCLVELKTHTADLTSAKPVRSGTFSPSRDLVDAISQSHTSAAAAERELRESFQPVDALGEPISSTVYNFRPRSFVVIGQLSEFGSEHGINAEKFGSFELFRRNLNQPEVITFDELYARARYIVDNAI